MEICIQQTVIKNICHRTMDRWV